MPLPEPAGAREFVFTARDFNRVVNLIYRHAGIRLAGHKESLVYSRLSRRLRSLGLRQFRAYLDKVEQEPAELELFINALTTNLTSFFREEHHFKVLHRYLQSQPSGKPVTIWSAAASTGEEAYSIAITAAEAYQRLDPPVRIYASDLDTKVLETARLGIYSLERLEGFSMKRKQDYCLRGVGGNTGLACIKPALRQLVEFRRLNLLDAQWPDLPRFEVIFCRNVMIYFDKPTQLTLLTHLLQHLKPGGLLFLGHSESFSRLPPGLKACGHTSYQWQGPAHE